MEGDHSPRGKNPDENDLMAERAKKQQFLKENIADKGYNKQEFAYFMNRFKESQANIDMWTLEELQDIVHKFQEEFEPEEVPPTNLDDSEEYPRSRRSSESEKYDIKENNDIHNVDRNTSQFIEGFENICASPSDKENSKAGVPDVPVSPQLKKVLDFEDGIKISDKTSLSKMEDVVLEITEATHNSGGLFSFSYYEYTIETHPFGWSVIRREQDFKRLRDYILKKFPQFVIPPLLQTKILFNHDDLETKKIYYQEFLRAVIENEELCA